MEPWGFDYGTNARGACIRLEPMRGGSAFDWNECEGGLHWECGMGPHSIFVKKNIYFECEGVLHSECGMGPHSIGTNARGVCIRLELLRV